MLLSVLPATCHRPLATAAPGMSVNAPSLLQHKAHMPASYHLTTALC